MKVMSEIIAVVTIAASVITGTALVPATVDTERVRVGAFNVQVFGRAKRSKPDVMDVLVDISLKFDVLVVQEVRDSSLDTPQVFLEQINAESTLSYAMVEGPRLGRTGSKEQYVIYYVPAKLELLDAFTWPDPDDEFEREPIVATFRSGNLDFTIIACHIKPDDAENELRAMQRISASILTQADVDRDLILLGDFNADGSYLDEEELPSIFPQDLYRVLISNDVDTMTTSDNTYDRIIVTSNTTELECDFSSSSVMPFDVELGLCEGTFVSSVSDHFPVYTDLITTGEDDD